MVTNQKKQLTVIDFFCGAGGFSEGFRMAGFEIIMGIDNWQPAIRTHNLNHGLNDTVRNILDFEDIDEILNLPDSDIIVGSPPCVSFSLSNKGGNADKDLGVRLMRAYLRVVAVKKHKNNSTLKAWLLENVPNSRKYLDESYTFRDLDLEDWAYSEGLNPDLTAIKVRDNGDILSADDYGSGQRRKRLVCGEIISTGEFPYPEKSNKDIVVLSKLFKDFPKPLGFSSKIKTVSDPNYPEFKIKLSAIKDHFYDTGVYEIEWKKAREAKTNHPYMGIMSFPENMNNPSRTIMATKSASTRESILYKSEIDRHGDGEFRTPTIREAAIIMGFPLDYQFYGNESTKWRQVGNAVCVQLSFALAKKIGNELKIMLPQPNQQPKNLSGINFLDDFSQKTFDKPPTRNKKSLFRAHAIKSGNMTVSITNQSGSDKHSWSVVAHTGTGQGYLSIPISKEHKIASRNLINNIYPGFLESVDNDPLIRKYTNEELDKHNETYGYISNDDSHPYNIVKRIESHIKNILKDNDTTVMFNESPLNDIKSAIPLSQVMSIYALSKILV